MGVARDSGSRGMEVDGGSPIVHLSLGPWTCQKSLLRDKVPCQIILVLLKAKKKCPQYPDRVVQVSMPPRTGAKLSQAPCWFLSPEDGSVRKMWFSPSEQSMGTRSPC